MCTLVNLPDPLLPELISTLGLVDCIWLDLEHGGMSVETASLLMRAARQGGCDILARPAKGEFMRMGRLLEGGANGIMYPRCESAAEARELVRWAKFAPLGERGFAGGNADAGYGASNIADYVAAANRETFLAPQIESPNALAQARAIAEVEGVDMLFFGPGDFSVLSGHPGQFDHPSVLDACEETCAAALAAGKRFGTLSFGLDKSRRLLKMGASFLVYSADMIIMHAGLAQLKGELAALGAGLAPKAPAAAKSKRATR